MADHPEPPKIEFPCPYPIKVMGQACEDLHVHVITVMHRHDPEFDADTLTIRDSNKGNYQSLTVTITATGKPQLEAIFIDLKTSPLVKMVL